MMHNIYKCPACKKIVPRESTKAWMRSYCEETGKMTRLKMIKMIIGIDPALRDNGFAVAWLDTDKREVKSARFRNYNHFVRYMCRASFHTVNNVPVPDPAGLLGALVIIEDSNRDKTTFRGRYKSRNEYASNSRDAGKNMAVCSLAIDALKEAGAQVRAIAPSEKPKWTPDVLPIVLKQDRVTWINQNNNADECWAVAFAVFGMGLRQDMATVRNSR